MDRRQISLVLVMRALDVPLRVDQFDDRLVVQKAVYLAQARGVDLGYFFRWHLRGPYCRALTSDAYTISLENEDEAVRWVLNEESKTALRELRDLLPSAEDLPRARWLELLASIHYLVRQDLVSPDDSAGVQETLGALDKSFELEDVERALGALRDHGLV